jgi:hypothetical protein
MKVSMSLTKSEAIYSKIKINLLSKPYLILQH